MIDIDFFHIENCVSSLVKKNPSLQVIHGDLVAGQVLVLRLDYYLDSVAAEAEEAAREAGRLPTSELALRFSLPIDSILSLLQSRTHLKCDRSFVTSKQYTSHQVWLYFVTEFLIPKAGENPRPSGCPDSADRAGPDYQEARLHIRKFP